MKTHLQGTSIKAYYDIKNSLGKRQKQVLDFLKAEYPYVMTNNEIAHELDLPINCVTPRIFELRKRGLVRAYGKRHCSITGRLAIEWGLDSREKKQLLFL